MTTSSNGLGDLPNGGTASVEGTGPAVQIGGSKDVVISVRFSDGQTLNLDATNPFIGYPIVLQSGCSRPGYSVGEQRDWHFNDHGLTVERRADDA